MLVENLKDYVDFYLIETQASIDEAYSAAKITSKLDSKDIFVSWSLQLDGKIQSGESITEAIKIFEEGEKNGQVRICGYGMNCCSLDAAKTALKEIG